MATGQLSYLQLANRILIRLGEAQVTTLQSVSTDTWADIVKTLINDAITSIVKEHDWSPVATSGTFTTSSRTYDLTTNFSNFQREIDLTDTSNGRVLEPVDFRTLDYVDPEQDDAGVPMRYAIHYPNLLFDKTPTSVGYRLRYFKRATALSADADKCGLSEDCDLAIINWVVWQLLATREDDPAGAEAARAIYDRELARAIGQDRRRTDRIQRLQILWPSGAGSGVPAPPRMPSGYDNL